MTKYFMSFATPREAKPLVYDQHEHLTTLHRHEALQLFGDPRELGDVWEKRGTYPTWDVYGVESSLSVDACRGVMDYQRARLESSGYPCHQQSEWVIATTEPDDDDGAVFPDLSWHHGFVRENDGRVVLAEIVRDGSALVGYTVVTLSDFLFDGDDDGPYDPEECEEAFSDAINQASGNIYTWKDFQ